MSDRKLGVGEILICNKDTAGRFESLKHFIGKLIVTIGGGHDKIYIVEEKDKVLNDVKSIQSKGIPTLLNTQKFPEDFTQVSKENRDEHSKDHNEVEKEMDEKSSKKNLSIKNERKESSATVSKYGFGEANREEMIRSTPNKYGKKGTNLHLLKDERRDQELEEDPPYEPESGFKVENGFDDNDMAEYFEGNGNEEETKMLAMDDALGMNNNHEHQEKRLDELRLKEGRESMKRNTQKTATQSQEQMPFPASSDEPKKLAGTQNNNTQEDFMKSFSNVQISQIVKGKNHLLKLTVDGKVYGLGKSYFGVVGLGGSKSSIKPTLIPNLAKVQIEQIACGMYHSLARSSQGDLYSWGIGFEGQLGLNNSYKVASSPRYVNFFYKKPVKFITCGHNYSLCITDDSKLWGWGENKLGQLGLGKIQVVEKPTQIEIFDVDGGQIGCSRPDSVLNGNIEREYTHQPLKACFAAAGYSHSAVVTEEGFLLTFGLNIYGQLGMGNTKSTFEPHLIEKNENGESLGKVVKVGCNSSGTFIINDQGELYTCGFGEIGHGESKRAEVEGDIGGVKLPKQIVGNRSYSDIFCNNNGVVVFCPLKIYSISPSSGPSNGGTILSIIGSAFKDFSKLSVRFNFGGIQQDIKATFDKITSTIFVKTPAFTSIVPNLELPSMCKIQITFDGYYFTDYNEPFLIYNNQTKIAGVVPKCGPTGGGSNLQINIALDNIPSKYLFTLTVGFQAKTLKEDNSIFGKKRKKRGEGNLDDTRSQINNDERSVFGGNGNQANNNRDKDLLSVNPMDLSPIDVTVEKANWYCSYGTYENGVISCKIPKIENFAQNQVEYNVDIAINGQQFSGFPMLYRFYEIKYEKIDPTISIVEGGLVMKLYGSGLFDSLTKKAKISSTLGERFVDLQWDRVEKALILESQPLGWIANNEELVKTITQKELFEEYSFNIEITMNNLDWIKFGSYKYYDPKVLRCTFVTFPDNCASLQDRIRYYNISNQDPVQEEEQVAIEALQPPSDPKAADAMKKSILEADNSFSTVARRSFNAINIYSKYFPFNAPIKVKLRSEHGEYEFNTVYKNRYRICCLFYDMPKIPPGQHEMEILVSANGQQYTRTKFKFLFLQMGSMSPEELVKLDIEEGKKGKKPSGKKK